MEDKKKEMLKHLKESLGIVVTACKLTGIGRATHYKWLKKDHEYRAAVEDISEDTMDLVESKLLDAINDGKEKSIHYYLDCKGRKRGYGSGVIRSEDDDKITEWDVRRRYMEDEE
jgi:hypothetical protein